MFFVRLAACAWLSIPSSVLCAPLPYGKARTPDRLRFRVQSVLWWSGIGPGGRTEATDYFDASPGDDIDGSRVYPGWMGFAAGSPFRLGKIVDSEHAWIHFSGGIRPQALGMPNGKLEGDSIIVSTVDRAFSSFSMDAGLNFNVRIEPMPLEAKGSPMGMQILHRGRMRPGGEGFRESVESAEAIGVFHILAIRAGHDSVQLADRRIATTELQVMPRELWWPGPLVVGKSITVLQEGPPATDSSWTPMAGSTPMFRGDNVILFLGRGGTGAFKNWGWSFSSWRGYGLLANEDRLVFSAYGRGVPIEKFRNDVRLVERMRFHAGQGALMGRVLHAGSGRPIAGATVRLEDNTTTRSGEDGWFEMFDLPIGQSKLFVRDSLGEVSAPVELTDEGVDSLELRIAQPNDPDPRPRSLQLIQEEIRPKNGKGDLVLPYDVLPLAYQRSEPSYPPTARRSGFEGNVAVFARVDSVGHAEVRADGTVAPEILDAAEACARRWKFRPGLKDGRPVTCSMVLTIRFAHPKSGNLATPEDRQARMMAQFPGGTRAEVVVEASATFDSVTKMYHYSYRVVNQKTSSRDLVAFALMPTPERVDDLERPDGWNGFFGCGGRRDVVGWELWGDDYRRSASDFAVSPNQEIANMGFQSSRPPTRIRWFASMTPRGDLGTVAWECGSGSAQPMLGCPVQGTIVGPAPARGP
jgi:hypothetical protein